MFCGGGGVVLDGLSPVSEGRRFSLGRSSSSPFGFLDGSVSSSIGAFEFGFLRSVGLFGSVVEVLSGRFWFSSAARRDFTSLNSDVVTTYSGLDLRSVISF